MLKQSTMLNPWFISTPNYNEAQCQAEKLSFCHCGLEVPGMSSPHGQEEEEEGGMPKAAAQSNAPLAVHPGSARVSGRGWPTREGRGEGREAAYHLLLLLRPRFGSSLPFSWDKNVTPSNWIRLGLVQMTVRTIQGSAKRLRPGSVNKR